MDDENKKIRLDGFKRDDDGALIDIEICNDMIVLKQKNLLDGVTESIVIDFIRARKINNFLKDIDLENPK